MTVNTDSARCQEKFFLSYHLPEPMKNSTPHIPPSPHSRSWFWPISCTVSATSLSSHSSDNLPLATGKPSDWDRVSETLASSESPRMQRSKGKPSWCKNPSGVPQCNGWVKPSPSVLGAHSLKLGVETFRVPGGLGTLRYVARQRHLMRPPISDKMLLQQIVFLG